MIEGTQLAALVASKVCHDLVEPMNAIIQGMELLRDGDASTKADAMNLVDQGVAKAWAKLDFFRFAVGGALVEGEGELDEARQVAERLYGALRPELVWSAPAVVLPKAATRVVVNLLMIANECLPRGGTVELTAAKAAGGTEVTVTASGPRAKLKEATAAALRGDGQEHLSGHTIQPTLTSLLARQGGVELATRESEDKVEFIARSAAFQLG